MHFRLVIFSLWKLWSDWRYAKRIQCHLRMFTFDDIYEIESKAVRDIACCVARCMLEVAKVVAV